MDDWDIASCQYCESATTTGRCLPPLQSSFAKGRKTPLIMISAKDSACRPILHSKDKELQISKEKRSEVRLAAVVVGVVVVVVVLLIPPNRQGRAVVRYCNGQ